MELLAEDFQETESARERRALHKIEVVQRECQRLQDLLDNFLRFAKIGSLKLEPSDLNQQIKHVLEFFRPKAKDAGIEVICYLDPDLPSVVLDRQSFHGALINLLLNAQQAMPNGGEIVIRTMQTATGVALDLIDTGTGMDARTQVADFRGILFHQAWRLGAGVAHHAQDRRSDRRPDRRAKRTGARDAVYDRAARARADHRGQVMFPLGLLCYRRRLVLTPRRPRTTDPARLFSRRFLHHGETPMQPDSRPSRRQFITAAAAAATLAWTAKSYSQILGANDRIHIGFIGVGGMGSGHVDACLKLKPQDNLEFLGVADCWKTRAEKHAGKLETKPFGDYRQVLDIKEIDYVTIAVPEHTHARITMDAMDAGKAVYCEKPMTHSIEQAQAVMQKQQQTGKALQVGVQAMSDDSYSSAAKAIKDGVIGQVVQAQIEYVRRYDKLGPWRLPEVELGQPRPADLDWKAWLGDAPSIPWNPHHYFEWRNYAAYSGGIATDLFIHRITRIMRACNLLYPRRVVGMGGIWQWNDGRDLPDNFEMICEYPRGMTVYVLGTMSNRVPVDHLIRGYRGTLTFNKDGWVAKDKDDKVLAEHKKTGAEDIHLHHTNLHNHLRTGEPLNCPIELGMAGVVAVNMANQSWRSNRMMGWDAKNQKMVAADTLDLSHLPDESTAAEK